MSSYFKYRNILLFWDGMVHSFPLKFNSHLRRPKAIILVINITMMCLMFVRYNTEFYWIFKPEAGSASMKLAEPWTGNVLEARVAYVVTAICFLSAFSTWVSAGLLFTVAVYYLIWEFMDLHRLMCDDTQLVMQLTLHKRRHLCLSQMVGDLDDILWGYIGTSMIMCTFDMCFVISALHESQRSYEIMGFVALLSVLFLTLGILVVPSISINTWVS